MFENYTLTVIVGEEKPRDLQLDGFGSDSLSFGRHPSCDIVLESAIASNFHGRFAWHEGRVYVLDNQSTNGIYVNGLRIAEPTALEPGDTVTFESDFARAGGGDYGILLVLGQREGEGWASFRLTDQPASIGRDPGCDVQLEQVSVSRVHAYVVYDGARWCIQDNNSTNGVFLNGRRVAGAQPLTGRDVIFIGGAKLLFSDGVLYYHRARPGIEIVLENVSKTVPTKG